MAYRFQYDCEDCRFNWCCGYRCACALRINQRDLSEPPLEVKEKVNRERWEYNGRIKYIEAGAIDFLPAEEKAKMMRRIMEERDGR